MKTPAEAVKEHFWIGAKGGLLDLKHYLKMREAVWLFLYLLRNQTSLTPSGEGQVNHGHPLTIAEIAADLKGIPERNIERWLSRLRREGYIRTDSHSNQGITFWIAKAKAKTRKVKLTQEEAVSMEKAASAVLASRKHPQVTQSNTQNIPPQMAVCSENIPPNMAECSAIIPPQMAECSSAESPQPLETKELARDFETPTPKGFTPNNLSYYKHTSGAEDAPSPPVSLKELGKKLQPPREQSRAELDERRRELLLQAERIKLKYPTKGSSPGKVLEMPREATA